MMLKKLQKKLDLSWIKKNSIWDIVVYGSFIRGKSNAREIDIAVILSQMLPLKRKLIMAQELRHKLYMDGYTFDVKVVDITDMLNPGFLGREGILAEGFSLIKRCYLSEQFGFSGFALIEYNLTKLSQSKQKILYYALQGRKKGTGILAKFNGRIISKGVLQVPTKYSEEIKELLEQHKVNYTINFVLSYRILH